MDKGETNRAYQAICGLEIRTMKMREIPQLERMYFEVFGRWLYRPLRFAEDKTQIYNPRNARHVWVAVDCGRVVASVSGRPAWVNVDGALLRWAAYGSVMTAPAYRGLGLGTRLNELAWNALRRDGTDGVYISGGRNLYRRMGSIKAGCFRYYLPRGRDFRGFRAGGGTVQIKPGRLSDTGILVEMCRRQRVGYRREPADFRAPLKYGLANIYPGKLWMICRHGRPVAYGLVSWYPGGNGRILSEGELADYGGDRTALFLAIPEMARRTGLARLGVTVNGRDDEMNSLFRSVRVGAEWKRHSGTQVILDAVRTVRRLAPYFRRHLGWEAAQRLRFRRIRAGGYEFTLGKVRFPVGDDSHFASLLLGDRPDRFPLLLPRRGVLRDILSRVFPVPFPPAGINWI